MKKRTIQRVADQAWDHYKQYQMEVHGVRVACIDLIQNAFTYAYITGAHAERNGEHDEEGNKANATARKVLRAAPDGQGSDPRRGD